MKHKQKKQLLWNIHALFFKKITYLSALNNKFCIASETILCF